MHEALGLVPSSGKERTGRGREGKGKKEVEKEKRNPRFSHWKLILEYLIELWLPDKIGLYKGTIK